MSLGLRLKEIIDQSEPLGIGSLHILRVSRQNNEMKRAALFVEALKDHFRTQICSNKLPVPVRVPEGSPFRTYQWAPRVERFDRHTFIWADHLNPFFDWCEENGLRGEFVRRGDWDPDSVVYYYEVQVNTKDSG